MSLAEAIGRLAPQLPEFRRGEVWLAGAGPGSLGCLTLEVVAALGAADAVVYDALVAPEALRAARADAALHFVGKRRGQPSTPQATIAGLVAADPIDRTAIVFVGPGLAAEGFRESALYDAAYRRRFRGRAG